MTDPTKSTAQEENKMKLQYMLTYRQLAVNGAITRLQAGDVLLSHCNTELLVSVRRTYYRYPGGPEHSPRFIKRDAPEAWDSADSDDKFSLSGDGLTRDEVLRRFASLVMMIGAVTGLRSHEIEFDHPSVCAVRFGDIPREHIDFAEALRRIR